MRKIKNISKETLTTNQRVDVIEYGHLYVVKCIGRDMLCTTNKLTASEYAYDLLNKIVTENIKTKGDLKNVK